MAPDSLKNISGCPKQNGVRSICLNYSKWLNCSVSPLTYSKLVLIVQIMPLACQTLYQNKQTTCIILRGNYGDFNPQYVWSRIHQGCSILTLSFLGENRYQGCTQVQFQHLSLLCSRAAVVHLNLRAGSTFPVPVCTVSPRLLVNKADTQQHQPVQQGLRGQTLCFIQVEFTFTKGAEVRVFPIDKN